MNDGAEMERVWQDVVYIYGLIGRVPDKNACPEPIRKFPKKIIAWMNTIIKEATKKRADLTEVSEDLKKFFDIIPAIDPMKKKYSEDMSEVQKATNADDYLRLAKPLLYNVKRHVARTKGKFDLKDFSENEASDFFSS
jgi:hypothetical protein